MNPHEVRKLVRTFDSSEIRHGRHWYLLAEDGPYWTAVGGPYGTREEARTTKKVALAQWLALPNDEKLSYWKAVAV